MLRRTLGAAWASSSSRPAAARMAVAARHYAAPAAPNSDAPETFLCGTSAAYLDGLYCDWLEDPSSVHASWDSYFKNIKAGAAPGAAHAPPEGGLAVSGGSDQADFQVVMQVQTMVRAFQDLGHSVADLDPLGINQADLGYQVPATLDPQHYGFSEADLSREFELGSSVTAGYLGEGSVQLGTLLDQLKHTYCGPIGFEFMHLQSRAVVNWFRERVECYPMFSFSKAEKLKILERLQDAELFESFLQMKYSNDKRFGLEGCEALIPGMKALIDSSTDYGVENIVIGMPHRGRLNVLTQVMEKPMESVFSEFAGQNASDEGSGDVKYHLGTSVDRVTPSGKVCHMSLAANPSHLEAVDPLVLGKTRAVQDENGGDTNKAMSILLHGDAAFAGQGIVYETFGLSELESYSVGGTVHIVVNNQIGFTTDPRFSRSTPYCCDLGKAFNAPIFHVNGDDPEAVVFVCNLAAEWRKTYQKDVVVDIVCYRRHGHNEQDQPEFTQPKMYKHIAKHQTGGEIYANKLIAEGHITAEEVEAMKSGIIQKFEDAFSNSANYEAKKGDWLESRWGTAFKSEPRGAPTGLPEAELKEIGMATCAVPDDFKLHRSLTRILKQRSATIEKGETMDWAACEAMAFGSMLKDGVNVRLSGQDVERGTFSHRHAVVHDQDTQERHTFLDKYDGEFSVSNSHLSEFGVLGFELGYSMHQPKQLNLWEAQFGDFANTAQCIIDQFISSGEQKWLRQAGLVMLLPHGYEGMGPEHSSARLERFLQMTDDEPDTFPDDFTDEGYEQAKAMNWQVIMCSTSGNYFHALRRQLTRGFRKPLISMQPKSLLRLPASCSDMSEISEGTRFQRLIPDPEPLDADADIKRLVFCSGKVYFDLARAREMNGITDVAIARVEQIAPFPFDMVAEQADRYPNAEIVWCQEEPLNQGAWAYVDPRIETALGKTASHEGSRPAYTGRLASAATSTGNKYAHIRELHEFLAEAVVVGGGVAEVDRVEQGFPIWKL